MKTNVKSALFALMASSLLSACSDDHAEPHDHNENELITTVQLVLKDSLDPSKVTRAIFKDPDGPGGAPVSQFDTLRLTANTSYLGQVILLNESKSPADTISNEIKEEADAHQFFYTANGGANITVKYKNTDVDKNGVPVGLYPLIKTGAVSQGKLKVILKHQPNVKPTTGLGDMSKGATDVEVDFPVTVR